ncbi:VOC family protein [Saccharothrix violaceirubra]|uniref:Catechol 2,3-dioxygenase-like lactoylglutathione lyase family enzyme n=1 Tax=Saccharothrix violaceirubra TaxID=413306 RepID=A0A7W7T0H8_9PSEU|nr:VOC family protein [Saccharothrix violaceirubra]MBB4964333.1 catechol 2,3-dioxygenase-like lactoylglutathione lyase family enzyme [Saccharothrix violaceirubra]
MDIKLSHSFIAVDDQDKALAFYRDVLGFELRTDTDLAGFRWLTVGIPGRPDWELVLENPRMGRSPEDGAAVAALAAKGVLGTLIFYVDSCDELFERVSASGAEVVQEPIDQPYGVRDCAFRDPAGNHLRFSGPVKG